MIQKVVIGCLLLDYSVHDMVMPILKREYFEGKYQLLFDTIKALYSAGEPVDTITIFRKIGKSQVVTPLEIAQITSEIASAANIMTYIQELKNDYCRRSFTRLTGIFLDDTEDAGERISDMIKNLSQLQEDHTIAGNKNIVEVVSVALDELYKENKTHGMIGLPTMSGRINSDTRGLRPGELVIVAGRPGMGKTAFALSVVRSMCEHFDTVAYFSMEMRATELAKRMIKSFPNFDDGAGEISRYRLHLFDRGGIDIDYIRSNARLISGCKAVFIDYLGLMRVNTRVKRAEAIGEVTRALKAFAQDTDMTVVLLAQLNRDSEQRSTVLHKLSDLRESGDIEQDADKVFFITRPGMLGEQKMQNIEDRRVIIQKEKDRNGRAPVIFNMVSNENFTVFHDEADMPSDDAMRYSQTGKARAADLF